MWQAYPKMYTEKDHQLKATGNWVCTEKIHGANLAIEVSQNSISFCKRKKRLRESDYYQFFDISQDLYSLQDKAEALDQVIKKKYNQNSFVAYGELCGGYYPGESDQEDKRNLIQKEIYYSPNREWVLFDILINNEWLSYSELEKVCLEAGVLLVPLIQKGKYQDLMQISAQGKTLLPQLLSLEEIKNNNREGIVLRPDHRQELDKQRQMIKRKDKEFLETTSSKNGSYNNLQKEASAKINWARLNTAKSKVGNNKNKMIEEATADVLEEMQVSQKDKEKLRSFVEKEFKFLL